VGLPGPAFDTVSWVLDLAGRAAGRRVLDAGCGNGLYLHALRRRQVSAAGCDLSPGMLSAITYPAVAAADVTRLPFRDRAFHAVLAAQVLDLVPGRATASGAFRTADDPAALVCR
jgi:ubiquinone/menaquinone biosynthesis C-methylase UbiE